MTPELASALAWFIYVLTLSALMLPMLIMSKTYNWFDSKKSTEHKVVIDPKSSDNIYTQLAAEQNRKAQEAARDAAKLVLQAEETRLERIRLEQERDLR